MNLQENESFDLWRKELKKNIEGIELKRNVSWKQVTTLGIGGDIPLLAYPNDAEQLKALLRYCSSNGIAYFILGGGSNTVGMDGAYNGIIISLRRGNFVNITPDASGGRVSCGAGAILADLARQAARLGMGGITRLAGIPGTVGGALRMNAGAEGRNISEFVVAATGVWADGSEWELDPCTATWDYRTTPVPSDVIVLSASFVFPLVGQEAAEVDINMVVNRRRNREPKGRSAGCAFRNISMNDSAGRLIDNCDLKNYARGGAIVSNKHANFIMNSGNATEADYVTLMRSVRKNIADATGLYLRPEVVFVNRASFEEVMQSSTAPHVLVLCGGDNSEREVSLRSGETVAQALSKAGYQVELEDITKCEYTKSMKQADVIFPILHGGFGEDGTLQAICEQYAKKFVGCGSTASKIIINKVATKRVLDACNIATAKWAVLTPDSREIPRNIKFPVVVKVPTEGSSFGIDVVKNADEWAAKIDRLFADKVEELLVEEYIEGVEISVPVVDGKVFPPVEIRPANGFYDYDAKYVYSHGQTCYFCPSVSLSENAIDKAKSAALKLYCEVGAKQMLRVDFIVDADGEPVALEGNSLPGFTATSLVPRSAAVFGYTVERLCAELVRSALD